MAGQSQSECRQQEQLQAHSLVKKPFRPGKVLANYLAAFEGANPKSRRVKGTEGTERNLVSP